jgi:hypothetical protein
MFNPHCNPSPLLPRIYTDSNADPVLYRIVITLTENIALSKTGLRTDARTYLISYYCGTCYSIAKKPLQSLFTDFYSVRHPTCNLPTWAMSC